MLVFGLISIGVLAVAVIVSIPVAVLVAQHKEVKRAAAEEERLRLEGWE